MALKVEGLSDVQTINNEQDQIKYNQPDRIKYNQRNWIISNQKDWVKYSKHNGIINHEQDGIWSETGGFWIRIKIFEHRDYIQEIRV